MHGFEKLDQRGVFQAVVRLGRNVLQVYILRFYGLHRLVDSFARVVTLG